MFYFLSPLEKKESKDIDKNMPISVPSADSDNTDINEECVDPSDFISFDSSKCVEYIDKPLFFIVVVPNLIENANTNPEVQIYNHMTLFAGSDLSSNSIDVSNLVHKFSFIFIWMISLSLIWKTCFMRPCFLLRIMMIPMSDVTPSIWEKGELNLLMKVIFTKYQFKCYTNH